MSQSLPELFQLAKPNKPFILPSLAHPLKDTPTKPPTSLYPHFCFCLLTNLVLPYVALCGYVPFAWEM